MHDPKTGLSGVAQTIAEATKKPQPPVSKDDGMRVVTNRGEEIELKEKL